MTAQPKPTAAEQRAIDRVCADRCIEPEATAARGMVETVVLALSEAGLLATAEHDAQVRADAITEVWDQAREAIATDRRLHQQALRDAEVQALRDAAEAGMPRAFDPANQVPMIRKWLHVRADRIAGRP